MRCLTPILALASALALACESEPEIQTDRWLGIATPVEQHVAAQDTAPSDTTWIRVIHDHHYPSNVTYATFSIWETEPDPCDLTWLDDDGYPCYYITKGTGFAVPFAYPMDRVIDFTLPTLGECELGGQVDRAVRPPEWVAHLRCGETKALYYDVILSEY